MRWVFQPRPGTTVIASAVNRTRPDKLFSVARLRAARGRAVRATEFSQTVSDAHAGSAVVTTDEEASVAALPSGQTRPSSPGWRTGASDVTLLEALPASLAAFGAVVAVGGTQGGYFPTMWGPSALGMLLVVGAWLARSGRTDAGRADAILVGLLLALASWIALSISWSAAPALSVLDLERVLVPIAGVTLIVLLARRLAVPDIGFAVAM